MLYSRQKILDLGLVGLIAGVDLVTKALAQSWEGQYGAIEVRRVLNPGVIAGQLGHVSGPMKFAGILGFGLIFMTTYLLTRLVLREPLPALRFGFVLIVGGVLGNLLDRIFGNGVVVDFLLLSFGDFQSPVFNVADVSQLLGLVLLFGAVTLWRDRLPNFRNTFLVMVGYQLRLCFIFAGLGLFACAISFSCLNIIFDVRFGPSPVIYFEVLLSLGISGLAFIVGLFVSHRIYGPIYALNRYFTVRDYARPFELREGDDLQEVAAHIRDGVAELRRKT